MHRLDLCAWLSPNGSVLPALTRAPLWPALPGFAPRLRSITSYVNLDVYLLRNAAPRSALVSRLTHRARRHRCPLTSSPRYPGPVAASTGVRPALAEEYPSCHSYEDDPGDDQRGRRTPNHARLTTRTSRRRELRALVEHPVLQLAKLRRGCDPELRMLRRCRSRRPRAHPLGGRSDEGQT